MMSNNMQHEDTRSPDAVHTREMTPGPHEHVSTQSRSREDAKKGKGKRYRRLNADAIRMATILSFYITNVRHTDKHYTTTSP
jgi:hypothetical protein